MFMKEHLYFDMSVKYVMFDKFRKTIEIVHESAECERVNEPSEVYNDQSGFEKPRY